MPPRRTALPRSPPVQPKRVRPPDFPRELRGVDFESVSMASTALSGFQIPHDRSTTLIPRTFKHGQGPFDHPPTWTTFEGIMYRREWTNPYPEDSPLGRAAACKRALVLKARLRARGPRGRHPPVVLCARHSLRAARRARGRAEAPQPRFRPAPTPQERAKKARRDEQAAQLVHALVSSLRLAGDPAGGAPPARRLSSTLSEQSAGATNLKDPRPAQPSARPLLPQSRRTGGAGPPARGTPRPSRRAAAAGSPRRAPAPPCRTTRAPPRRRSTPTTPARPSGRRRRGRAPP